MFKKSSINICRKYGMQAARTQKCYQKRGFVFKMQEDILLFGWFVESLVLGLCVLCAVWFWCFCGSFLVHFGTVANVPKNPVFFPYFGFLWGFVLRFGFGRFSMRWARRAPPHLTRPLFALSLFAFSCMFAFVWFCFGGCVFEGLGSSEVARRTTSPDPKLSLFSFVVWVFLLLCLLVWCFLEGIGSSDVAPRATSPDPEPSLFFSAVMLGSGPKFWCFNR